MPTVTISLDDGTQLYQIGFADTDWTNLTAPPIANHHNTILVDAGTPAVAAIFAEDGVTVVTPGVDAVPPSYRDPTPNEAIAMLFDQFFQGMISAAQVLLAQQVVAPAPNTLTTAAPTTSISVVVQINPLPPVKAPAV